MISLTILPSLSVCFLSDCSTEALLINQACIQVCPKNPANFNVDNVRVAKLLGGGLHNCSIIRGMVLKNDAVGSIKKMEKAKVLNFCHVKSLLGGIGDGD